MQLKTIIAAGLSVWYSQEAQAKKCGDGQDLAPDQKLVVGFTDTACVPGKYSKIITRVLAYVVLFHKHRLITCMQIEAPQVGWREYHRENFST